MELRQLEYFVAVAEERNFTRAAERVHISQSGVSAQIRQLERELGAELFDRSGRTAVLTVAGKAALEHARGALAAAGAVGRVVGEVSDLVRGELVVGMVVGCAVTPLFEGVARFHRAHPGVGLSLVEDGSDRLVEGVRDGTADVALVGVAANPEGLEALTVVGERLVVGVPRGHPLELAGESVRLGDLVEHPVVCMPPGTGLRTVFDGACAARGVEAVVALQASAADAIVDLAVRGMGVAVLSESMVAHYADRLTAVVIEDVQELALLSLVWRERKSPALRELLVHLRAAFA